MVTAPNRFYCESGFDIIQQLLIPHLSRWPYLAANMFGKPVAQFVSVFVGNRAQLFHHFWIQVFYIPVFPGIYA